MNEIKNLDTKTTHHPKTNVDRLYLPRKSGERGLTQLETAYKTTTVGLETYLEHSDDSLLQLVREHEKRKKLYSIKEKEKNLNKNYMYQA